MQDLIYLFYFQVKGFKEYVDLYLRGAKKDEDQKVVHEICNPRWEVCVTVSDCGFQQASFVNSIATTKVRGISEFPQITPLDNFLPSDFISIKKPASAVMFHVKSSCIYRI